MNETFLKCCEKFEIISFPQQIKFFNEENISIESEGVLIFADDDKYDYHSLCFSSVLLENMLCDDVSFNSFLIPLKFIDSIKVLNGEKCFRVCPTENEGLFFSNNKRNLDIQRFSLLTEIEPEKIIKMKNQAFVDNEKLRLLLENVSHLTGLKTDEVLKKSSETRDLFFASEKGFNIDKVALAEKAKSLVGMQIVKDSQNTTFDCASFVAYLFMAELGIDILQNGFGSSTTGKIMSSDNGKCFLIDEYKSLEKKIDFVLNSAEVGDVMLFHRQSAKSNFVEEDNWFPGHVGIYIGDGKYIDARHRRGDVRIVDIAGDEYMNCFIGFKRFMFEKVLEGESFENGKQNL